MSNYNGWSNRETWLINLWFNPQSYEEILTVRMRVQEDWDNLPDYMRDFVSLDSIDWEELKDHLNP